MCGVCGHVIERFLIPQSNTRGPTHQSFDGKLFDPRQLLSLRGRFPGPVQILQRACARSHADRRTNGDMANTADTAAARALQAAATSGAALTAGECLPASECWRSLLFFPRETTQMGGRAARDWVWRWVFNPPSSSAVPTVDIVAHRLDLSHPVSHSPQP